MLKKIIASSILALSCGALVLSNSAETKAIELTVNNTDTYYKDVDTSLKGEAFIDNLTPIINAGFKSHSYDAANKILAESDRDPNNQNNIICFYTGDSLSQGQWNREHVWAKSHGFPSKSFNAYSDCHHLRPTLVKINSTRGSKDFGEVPNGSTDGKGNYWSGNTFEPRDEVKGDVARIMFYMVTKYNNVNNLTLELTNNVPTSGSTGHGKFGHLDTLIKWHYEDPVSDFEKNRNEVVYKYQNNRNPYIDHPEYVDLAFNTKSNVEVDNKKVERVINEIKALPDNITLDLKASVYNVKALYDELNYKEKELVTNYSKLDSAIKKIKELEGNTSPEIEKPNNPQVSNSISIDFNNVGNYSYSIDQEVLVNEYKFKTNAAYANTNDFRIGHNKQNLKLDPKYGLTKDNDVAVIESLFEVKNMSGIKLDLKRLYGNADKLDILVFNNNKYEIVKENVNIIGESVNEINFDKNVSGNLVLVFSGGLKPRVTLSKLDILVSNEVVNPIKDLECLTSVKFEIKNDKLVSAGLRFGGSFDKNIFDGATDFGILTVKSSDLNGKTINDLNTDLSLSSLESYFKTNNVKYLKTSAFNTKATILNNYKFAVVINNILEMPKENLTNVIYVIKDNKLYLSKETTNNFYGYLDILSKNNNLTELEKSLVDAAIKSL